MKTKAILLSASLFAASLLGTTFIGAPVGSAQPKAAAHHAMPLSGSNCNSSQYEVDDVTINNQSVGSPNLTFDDAGHNWYPWQWDSPGADYQNIICADNVGSMPNGDPWGYLSIEGYGLDHTGWLELNNNDYQEETFTGGCDGCAPETYAFQCMRSEFGYFYFFLWDDNANHVGFYTSYHGIGNALASPSGGMYTAKLYDGSNQFCG